MHHLGRRGAPFIEHELMMIARIGAQERRLAAALDMAAVGNLEAVDGGEEIDHPVHVENMEPGMADRDRRCRGHDNPFLPARGHETIGSDAIRRKRAAGMPALRPGARAYDRVMTWTWMWTGLAAVSLAAWSWLLFCHGGFWRAGERLAPADDRWKGSWPPVTAVVPARDEAGIIAPALRALAAQDYPGPLQIVVVDDNSTDGTGSMARAALAGTACEIIPAPPRRKYWSIA